MHQQNQTPTPTSSPNPLATSATLSEFIFNIIIIAFRIRIRFVEITVILAGVLLTGLCDDPQFVCHQSERVIVLCSQKRLIHIELVLFLGTSSWRSTGAVSYPGQCVTTSWTRNDPHLMYLHNFKTAAFVKSHIFFNPGHSTGYLNAALLPYLHPTRRNRPCGRL